MSGDLSFRIAITVIGLSYAAIRIAYTRMAIKADRVFFRPAGDIRQTAFGTVGFLIVVPVVAYVLAPGLLGWAAVPLGPAWRWSGVGLGLVNIALLLWVHRTLGRNFAVPAVAKENQALVTVGPYRWVRHPMYTVLFLICVAYFLISANWFIGALWIGWLVGTVGSMVGEEEAVMVARFGDEYRAYMRRTRRFVPGLV